MAVLNHADTIVIMGVISGTINTAMVKAMGGDDNEQIKAFWKGFIVGALIGSLTYFVAYVTTISIIQAGAIVGVGYSGYDIAVDLFVKHDYEGAAAKIPFLILDVLVLKRSFTVNTLLSGYEGHKGSIGEYNKKNTEYLKESITEGGSNQLLLEKTPTRRELAEQKLAEAASGINNKTIDSRTNMEIGRFIGDDRGNVFIEPVGGTTVPAGRNGVDTHTLYPYGSNYNRYNPVGHGNNTTPHGHGHLMGTGPGRRGQGPSIDVLGNVVPFNSPDAHWTIH